MGKTKIEWTANPETGEQGFTWNFLRGCSLATMPGPKGKPVLREGCRFCYAKDTGRRFCGCAKDGSPLAYNGLVIIQGGTAHWTGKIDFAEDHLLDPLRKKKPARFFVNSMSDLFHPNVKQEWIDLGFAVMLLCPQHIFQTLTKRPERQREYLNSHDTPRYIALALNNLSNIDGLPKFAERAMTLSRRLLDGEPLSKFGEHIHLGASIEDQQSADYVLPILYQTNWPMRWLSIEPLLGPIDFRSWLNLTCPNRHLQPDRDIVSCEVDDCGEAFNRSPLLHWAVVGSESGTRARPGDIAWIRNIIGQFKQAKLPLFVKQIGAHVITNGITVPGQHWPASGAKLEDTGKGYFRKYLVDKKGGDPSEWPEDLRVRQYPGEVLT